MFTPPVYTFPHTAGRCAIIAGMVYRGSAIPSLQGTYWYAQFCTSRIYSFVRDGTQVTQHVNRTDKLIADIGSPVDFIASFGRDNAGELYICSNAPCEVYKIVPIDCSTTNYCTSTLNSGGTAASIGSSGPVSVADQDFTLTVSGVLPGKVGLYFYSALKAQVPFGDGLRCVGGALTRMDPPSTADSSGTNSRALQFPTGEFQPGTVRNFQYWYRDPASPNLFNLSDGLSVGFCP